MDYILQYRTSKSGLTLYGFESKEEDAIEEGKRLFSEQTGGNNGAILEAIYAKPKNLLERSVVKPEISEKESPLKGNSCREDSIDSLL